MTVTVTVTVARGRSRTREVLIEVSPIQERYMGVGIATRLSPITNTIYSTVPAARSPCTAMHQQLVASGNADIDLASPFNTSATEQKQRTMLLQRHGSYQRKNPLSAKNLSESPPYARPGYLLAKDSLQKCVEWELNKLGCDNKNLQRGIDSLVECLLEADSPLELEFEKIQQGLKEGIQSGQCPMEFITRLNSACAADLQGGASSQAPCWGQKMEDVHRLLLSSPPPQARAGALTDQGPSQTIADQLRPTFWLPGVMADGEVRYEVLNNDVQFLPGVREASSVVTGGVSRFCKSPFATAVVAGGTFLTGGAVTSAAYWLYDKFRVNTAPDSDAPVNFTQSEWARNTTVKPESFTHEPGPYDGLRYPDSKEEGE